MPQAVADFLKKAMALNRERRPASAAEMRALLRQTGKHLADDAATIVGESPAAGMSDQKTVPAGGPATDAGQMAQAGTVAASAQTTGAIAERRESRPWKRPASIGGALGAIVVAAIIGAQLWFASPRSPSLIEQPLTPSQPATSPKPAESASSFDFEYVTIDSRGGIMNRRKGQAPLYVEDLGDGVKLEMVEIRGGTFMMGSPDTEVGRDGNEGPQRSVTVSRFYLGRYEVTQEQWPEVASLPKVSRDLSPHPSNFKGDKSPVESVSWLDAVEFCERLPRIKGKEYRLPSGAEWEYACRGGTTTAFAFGETITPPRAPYGVGRERGAQGIEEEWDEIEWLQEAAHNSAFGFLSDSEEDIYSLADGEPFRGHST